MASAGAALLLCGVFFLSTAYPACSCPGISQLSCEERPSDFQDWQPCGNNSFRCKGSTMEIRFGGNETVLFKVVRKNVTMDGLILQLEDPTLSDIFANASLDFLYRFPQRGPLFKVPSPTLRSSLRDLQGLDGNISHYIQLFSQLITTYQRTPCTAYDLYYTSKELVQISQHRALPKVCQLPSPADPPMFIWNLSKNDHINSLDGSFNITSVGFSRRHQLHPDCFDCQMTGALCDKGSEGRYSCGRQKNRDLPGNGYTPEKTKLGAAGEGHKHTLTKVIIGVTIPSGLLMLASFLVCLRRRNKKTKTASTSSTSSFKTLSSQRAWDEDHQVTNEKYLTHVFPFEELNEATNGFSHANELDHGGHGTVYRGKLRDGRPIAVKRLYENGCKRTEQFLNEIAILSHLRHPNLVALYGSTSRHSRELLLVYELIPNGTIADHLHGHRAAEGALTWSLRLRIAVETATALAHLHAITPPVIHRDVKTNNILLDRDFHVKVADFGLSRLFPMAATHVSTVPQGTPGYVDPEYHRCYQLTDKSDVYSFGVVLAELISSKPAVDVTRDRHEINLSEMALNKIQSPAVQELVDPKLGFETDQEVRRSIEMVTELVMRCLQAEGDIRPTMEDVLKVLHGIEDGFHQAEEGGDVTHMVGDDMGLQKNCAVVSPDSVMSKWWSRTTTPNASA